MKDFYFHPNLANSKKLVLVLCRLHRINLPEKLTMKISEYTENYNALTVSLDNYITTYKNNPSKHTPFRIEKMPLPKFDGRLRNYPQFKKDLEQVVLPPH